MADKSAANSNEATTLLARPLTASADLSIASARLAATARGPSADRLRPLRRLSTTTILRFSDGAALGIGLVIGARWGGVRPAVLITAMTVLVLVVAHRNRWRFTFSSLDDFPAAASAVGGATVVTMGVVALFDISEHPDQAVIGAIEAGTLIIAAYLLGRIVAFSVVRWLRRRGFGIMRALIIGSGAVAQRLATAFENEPAYGVDLLGHVDDDHVGSRLSGATYLGPLRNLSEIIAAHKIDVIVVAFGSRSSASTVDPLRDIGAAPCEVFFVPRFFELNDCASESDLVQGLPLVRLRRPTLRSASWRVKRLIDAILASVCLVVIAPVMLIVAIAVRLEAGPGVIYRQERVGQDGRRFTLYKFRSLKPVDNEDETTWTIDGDPRIGRVGKMIRATSLDELPQLFNIIKGDMSLVGPRPERPHFVERFSETVPGYRYRHRVPVGLTGFAVVHGLRGDTSISERAYFDNIYTESWSLWLDVKIVIRTAIKLVHPSATTQRAQKCRDSTRPTP